MAEQSFQGSTKNEKFWKNATKYASASNDELFVEEVAYMMVTPVSYTHLTLPTKA